MAGALLLLLLLLLLLSHARQAMRAPPSSFVESDSESESGDERGDAMTVGAGVGGAAGRPREVGTLALERWYPLASPRRGMILCGVVAAERGVRVVAMQKLERVASRRVVGVDEAGERVEVELSGPADFASMVGASAAVVAAFREGFPENWSEVWPLPPPPPPPEPEREQSKRPTRAAAAVAAAKQQRKSERLEQSKSQRAPPCYDEDVALLRQVRALDRGTGDDDSDADGDSDSDCDELFGGGKSRQGRRAGEKPSQSTGGVPGWTPTELAQLRRAVVLEDPLAEDLWERVATRIGASRTPDECQAAWINSAQASVAAAHAGESKPTSAAAAAAAKAKQTDAGIGQHKRVAKAGTARFRREMRETWQRVKLTGGASGETEDDATMLGATPFRPNRRDLSSGMMGDVDVLLGEQVANVVTPGPSFRFGKDGKSKRVLGVATRTTTAGLGVDEDKENSPTVLVKLDKSALDGYVMGFARDMKRLRKGVVVGVRPQQHPNTALPEPSGMFKSTSQIHEAADGAVSAAVTPGGSVRLKVDESELPDDE